MNRIIQSNLFVVIISLTGIGTLYPVLLSASIAYDYISYPSKVENEVCYETVHYLENIYDKKIAITKYHSWTESVFQLMLQMYVLVDETNTVQDLYGKPFNIISILISLGFLCYSFLVVLKEILPPSIISINWYDTFPGNATHFLWLYFKTMANIIVIIIVTRTCWILSASLMIITISAYLIYKYFKEIGQLQSYIDGLMKMIIKIITFYKPFKILYKWQFISTHLAVLTANIVLITICKYYFKPGPNLFLDNSYYIVIVLYSIGLTVLLLYKVCGGNLSYHQNVIWKRRVAELNRLEELRESRTESFPSDEERGIDRTDPSAELTGVTVRESV